MLSSYEAIYEHGRLTWVNEAPDPEPALVIVTVVKSSDAREVLPSHPRMAAREAGVKKTEGSEAKENPLADPARGDDWSSKRLQEVELSIMRRYLEDWDEDLLLSAP